MACNAYRDNIKNVFVVISHMMVILTCMVAAVFAFQIGDWLDSTGGDSIAYRFPRLYALWMPSHVPFHTFAEAYSAFIAVAVFGDNLFSSGGFIVFFTGRIATLLTVSLVTVWCCCVFMEIIYVFDIFAFVTEFIHSNWYNTNRKERQYELTEGL